MQDLRLLCQSMHDRLARAAAGSSHLILEVLRLRDFEWLASLNGHRPFMEPWIGELGHLKALSFFLTDEFSHDHPAIFPSTKETYQWAMGFVHTCGSLAQVERAIQFVEHGLATYERMNGEHRIASTEIGIEIIDLLDYVDHKKKVSNSFRDEYLGMNRNEKKMRRKLEKNSYPWMEHYIGYKTIPEIEGHYYKRATRFIQPFINELTMPIDMEVSGIKYAFYVEAVVRMIGWTLQHVGFADAHVRSRPHLDAFNQYTISKADDKLIESLQERIGFSYSEAVAVLDTLTVDVLHKERYATGRGFETPMLVRGGNKARFHVLSGVTNPIDVLHSGLKLRHRSSWDGIVDQREVVFRRQFMKLFSETDGRFISCNRSFDVKSAGKLVTDIDAAVLDCATGDLALVQLKWQDTFGPSMADRRSRAANFTKGADKWIAVMDDWLKTSPDLWSVLGIPVQYRCDGVNPILFVIGRHAVHFTGFKQDPRAAYISWNSLMAVIDEALSHPHPLRALDRIARERPANVIRQLNVEVGGFRAVRLGENMIRVPAMRMDPGSSIPADGQP